MNHFNPNPPAKFFLNVGVIRLGIHTLLLIIDVVLFMYVSIIPGLLAIMLGLRYRNWGAKNNIPIKMLMFYLLLGLGVCSLVFGILSWIPVAVSFIWIFFALCWVCVYAGDLAFLSLYLIHKNDQSLLHHHHHHEQHPSEIDPLKTENPYPYPPQQQPQQQFYQPQQQAYPSPDYQYQQNQQNQQQNLQNTYSNVRVSYQPPPPPPAFQQQQQDPNNIFPTTSPYPSSGYPPKTNY